MTDWIMKALVAQFWLQCEAEMVVFRVHLRDFACSNERIPSCRLRGLWSAPSDTYQPVVQQENFQHLATLW